MFELTRIKLLLLEFNKTETHLHFVKQLILKKTQRFSSSTLCFGFYFQLYIALRPEATINAWKLQSRKVVVWTPLTRTAVLLYSTQSHLVTSRVPKPCSTRSQIQTIKTLDLEGEPCFKKIACKVKCTEKMEISFYGILACLICFYYIKYV